MSKPKHPVVGAGGGKGGGGKPRSAVEAPDSLRSKAYARVIDLLCEGEIEGLVDGFKSIYLDDTPIQDPDGRFNFQRVVFEERVGTQAQTYVKGFPSSESLRPDINGIEVVQASPITRTVANATANYALVTIGIPALYVQDTSNGDINGTTVRYNIELQSNGGGFVSVVGDPQYTPGTIDTPFHASTTGTTAFRGHVKWEPASGGDAEGNPTNSVVVGEIQYRKTGTPDWIVLRQYNGSATSLEHTTTFAFSLDNLEEDDYEVRVNAIFTQGTVSIASFEYLISGSAVISGKTTSRYQRTHRIALTGAPPYDIRVTRLTADSVSSALQNKTFLDLMIEGVDQKLTFPNSAYVAISIDAEQFSQIPKRGYKIKGLLVKYPSNYDPITREYTGNWDGTFTTGWTNNPAWCWYDLVTNSRYGLGEFISEDKVDKWTLYRIAQYCDELVPDGFGGEEPRFTCNMYIQSQQEALNAIQAMASIFRGMVYWAGGQLVPTQDAPSTAVHLFTQANVKEGLFTYAGSSKKQRHTVAMVQWNDPEDHSAPKIEYVEDVEGISKYGIVDIQVPAIGCTSRGQAHRAGKWLLFTERMETEVVTFQTALEGFSVRPGQLFKVADSHRAGVRFGGRVVAASFFPAPPTITLDKPVVLESGKSYTIDVKLPDGTIEQSIVTNPPGTYTVLTLNTQFTKMPQKHANYIISASDLSPQVFRCVSAALKDDQWVEVQGLEFSAGKFDAVEFGIQLDELPISLLTVTPEPPTNLNLTDFIRLGSSGDLQTVLSATWTPPPGMVTSYFVEYKRGEGNWQSAPHSNVGSNFVEIPGVEDGQVYSVRITSVNAGGNKSKFSLEGSRTIQGKVAPPEDVTGFTHTTQLNGILFTWDDVADLDLDYYEVRLGATWAAGTVVFTGRATSFLYKFLPATTTKFWIKAVDTSGNYSLEETLDSVTIAGPNAPTAFTAVFAGPNAVFTWGTPFAPQPIEQYEIRYGSNFATGVSVGKVKSNTFTLKVDWTGSRTFHIVAIDSVGNEGTSASVVVNPTLYNAPVVSSEIIAVKLQLTWNTPTGGSLPIDTYEIRHGASFAAGSPVAIIAANSFRVPITWTGDRTFWVAAIDSAGNTGAAGSRVGTVNVPSAPVVSGQFNAENAQISWTTPAASLPIAEYEIRYGAPGVVWASASILGRVKGSTISFKANWVNERKFLVAAIDENSNVGAAGEVGLTVQKPSAPQVSSEVIDNNVLLKWSDSIPLGTLPVDRYEIRKGATFAGATVIGTVSAKFSLIFETSAGTYTYWVVGVDTANNYGTETGLTALVSQPPDFVLFNDFAAHPAYAGTRTNGWVEPETGFYITNVDPTETIQQHFDTRGWAGPQDQIDAGYPLVLVGKTTGSYLETMDYGLTVPSTKITMTPGYRAISGSMTKVPQLSTSPDNITYTDFPGVSSLFASGFRYVKFRQDFSAAHDGTGLATDTSVLLSIDTLKYVLDLKLKTFQGEKAITYIDADIAFTRSGATATRVNELGLMESVSADLPRFDYDPVTKLCKGWLLEVTRTNLILQSQNLGTTWAAVGTPTRVAANVTLGILSLDLIGDDAAGTLEGYTQPVTFTGDATKAVSVFIKKGTSTSSVLRVRDTTAGADRLKVVITWSGTVPSLSVTTGTHVVTENWGNGLYRLKFTTASVTAANTNSVEIYPATDAAMAVAGTGDINVGGFQVEDGVSPTSYILTTTGTVTRNTETALSSLISQYFNATEGTIFVEFIPGNLVASNKYVVAFSNGTNNELLAVNQSTSSLGFTVIDGGATQANPSEAGMVVGQTARLAFAYKLNDFAASRDGNTVFTDTSGTLPTVDRVNFGADGTGAQMLNGHLRQIVYYPTRLANATLQLAAAGQLPEGERIGWDFTEGNSLEPDGHIIDISSANFLDVQSIAIDPQSVKPQYSAFIFHDVPNPKFFTGFLFDQDGNRISGNVTYVIRGV